MDGHRFDELTRALAGGVTRRGVLRGVTAGITAAAGAVFGRTAATAAPSACAVFCADQPGPRKASCRQACRQCDNDPTRVCQNFQTGAFTCCPEGQGCFEGICCTSPEAICFGPGGATCCPEGTFCCGDGLCCPFETSCCIDQCCTAGTECCPGFGGSGPQCVDACPDGTFIDPETCECRPFAICGDLDCSVDPCATLPSNACGESEITGLCFCTQTLQETCACFQPICGVGPACSAEAPECPDGYGCVGCCGEPTCAPLCGTPVDFPGAANLPRWG